MPEHSITGRSGFGLSVWSTEETKCCSLVYSVDMQQVDSLLVLYDTDVMVLGLLFTVTDFVK